MRYTMFLAAASIALVLVGCRSSSSSVPNSQRVARAARPSSLPASTPTVARTERAPTQDEVDAFVLLAEHGNVAAVRQALKEIPSFVDQRNWAGWAALHGAALRNEVDVVKTLLKADANPNIRATGFAKGATPFTWQAGATLGMSPSFC